ncbi:methyl-accepting chemotaxis protein [Thiomicrospira pelophila]|uniref:methyl-accepting chemotaxis protein n=1 Tax=Thiomicrospira pelophila TaxID=934 RepID=UPI0004A7173C|nr:methyl-accepting chemotaxis protein [Thiomicrospira pelophila]
MFNTKLKNQLEACQKQTANFNSILEALDKSMAVIEFSPQGEIRHANQNFLDTVGYQLSQVVGQHHRIFVPDEIKNSVEYQNFWQELAQGKVLQQRFKRINKQGHTIWLEASYNPIFNENNQVTKVVKFATDISKQVEAETESNAKIVAISRAMAVIEFDLQGNILTANPNFCQAVGYELSEIIGQHHRLFVDSDYAKSAEYREFWTNLAKGELSSGTYRRLKKNGEELWLEASYNPVFNVDGEPYKVVKYATDIGANKTTQLLKQVVDDATQVLICFAGGDLNVRMKRHLAEDEESMFRDQIKLLSDGFNAMSEKLTDVITNAINASDIVSHAADEVAQGSSDLSQRVQQQAAAIEETSATMEQMTSAVQNTTDNAQRTADMAKQVQVKSTDSAQVMQKTIEAMSEIQASSHKISEIVTLIDGIAFQTNLLALNAAVEAARAGDHGRGFAVVAGEVRALAQKSAEAAKGIKKLIDESVFRINEGTSLATESGESLGGITSSIDEMVAMIMQIANASAEQSEGIRQVNSAITQIDDATQQNAALVEETTASSHTLSEQSSILQNDMAYFEMPSTLNKPRARLVLAS